MGVKIKNRKWHARTQMHGKPLTKKERWGQVIVTYKDSAQSEHCSDAKSG